jgi:hypothetical protein
VPNFDLIYKAIEDATSETDLKKKLDKLAKADPNFFIDEVKLYELTVVPFTAAGMWAFNKTMSKSSKEDYEKVEWLCNLGANPQEIIMGFAYGGNESQVSHYQNLYHVDPSAIAYAFILGHGREEGEQLAQEYLTTKGSRIAMAGALAFLGHEEELAKFYNQIKTEVDGNRLIQCICSNATAGGKQSLCEFYSKQYQGDKNEIKLGIVRANAFFGRHELVESAIQHGGKDLIEGAIKAYADAGFHEKVKALCKQYNVNPEVAAQGYMERGNKNSAKQFDLNRLLDGYLEERGNVRDKHQNPKEYKGLNFPFFQMFQKSFTEKKLAVAALKKAISGEQIPDNFDLTQHLSVLKDGNLGKALRQFVREGYADHFVKGKKVGTVTEFITNLDKKIKEEKKGHTGPLPF